MSVKENLLKIRAELPSHVKLVAVTKTHPVERIREAYEVGHKIFGENKAQEMKDKCPLMPTDVEWHFIGHLQTNKVKYIAPFVSLIHSVDSLRLLAEVNKEAVKNHRVIRCLLQFYIASEETKFGLEFDEACQLLESPEFKLYSNVQICGVMGMATFTDNLSLIRREFKQLRFFFEQIKKYYFPANEQFREISMGMSHDYQIAIEEGSTIVRIGSAIFGERNYV